MFHKNCITAKGYTHFSLWFLNPNMSRELEIYGNILCFIHGMVWFSFFSYSLCLKNYLQYVSIRLSVYNWLVFMYNWHSGSQTGQVCVMSFTRCYVVWQHRANGGTSLTLPKYLKVSGIHVSSDETTIETFVKLVRLSCALVRKMFGHKIKLS